MVAIVCAFAPLAMHLAFFISTRARMSPIGRAIDAAQEELIAVSVFLAAAARTMQMLLPPRAHAVSIEGFMLCGGCGYSLRRCGTDQPRVICPECGRNVNRHGVERFWRDWHSASRKPATRIRRVLLMLTLGCSITIAVVVLGLRDDVPHWINRALIGLWLVQMVWSWSDIFVSRTLESRSAWHWRRQAESRE